MPWQVIYRRFRRIAPNFLFILLVSYFLYHLVEGNHGLRAWYRLATEQQEAQLRLTAIEKQRDILRQRVYWLHPQHVCLDLVDEQARTMLGYLHPDEAILLDNAP